MPVVLEQEGFRFMIYYQDHAPAHTHIRKAGTEVVVNLGNRNSSPTVRTLKGMKPKNVKRALHITEAHQSYLLERWFEISE